MLFAFGTSLSNMGGGQDFAVRSSTAGNFIEDLRIDTPGLTKATGIANNDWTILAATFRIPVPK